MVSAPAWQPPTAARSSRTVAPKAASVCLPKVQIRQFSLNARRFGFPETHRIKTAGEFDHVFADPCRASNFCFTALARPNQQSHPRLGLVISKRCAKSAVQRNRLKRLIRESFRHAQQHLGGLDIVVIGKQGAVVKTNRELTALLHRQWQELARCKES